MGGERDLICVKYKCIWKNIGEGFFLFCVKGYLWDIEDEKGF